MWYSIPYSCPDATVTRAPRCNTPSQRVPGVAYVNKCVRYVDQPSHVLEYVGKSPANNFYAASLVELRAILRYRIDS